MVRCSSLFSLLAALSVATVASATSQVVPGAFLLELEDGHVCCSTKIAIMRVSDQLLTHNVARRTPPR